MKDTCPVACIMASSSGRSFAALTRPRTHECGRPPEHAETSCASTMSSDDAFALFGIAGADIADAAQGIPT